MLTTRGLMTLRDRVVEKLLENPAKLTPEQAEELTNRAEAYFWEKSNRRSVPDRAFWLWVDIALLLYRNSLEEGAIASIKRGDTTIQYESGEAESRLEAIDSRIALYKVAVFR